jgi:hypothetical protein
MPYYKEVSVTEVDGTRVAQIFFCRSVGFKLK